MKITPLLFVLLSLLGCCHATSVTPFATLGFTKAKLLSGMSLTACDPSPTVRNASCDNGLASARQVFRNVVSQKQSAHSEFVPYFDKDTAFVQMSPSNYGINIETFKKFGIRYYFGESTLWSNPEGRRFDLFDTTDVKFLQANFEVKPTDAWNGLSSREAQLFDNSVGLIIVGRSVITFGTDGAQAVKATVKFLRSRVKTIVVLNNDNTAVASSWYTMLQDIQDAPPDVYVYNNDTADLSLTKCAVVLGVRTCPISYSYDYLNLVHLYTDPSNINALVDAEASTESISGIAGRPDELDATFFSDHAFLLEEALKAADHDPVVGHMSIPMPAAGMTTGVFHCYKAECPIGTLRARALVHMFPGSHMSLSNSGGFRGVGWPAGDIRMSNIWEFNPFANTITVLKASGLKIWEIMNVSMSFYWQRDDYYHYGDRFLQGDGYEIDFDASKPQFTDRILAIRVRNPDTGVFEPLVRDKMYTVVTDAYMVQNMGDHAPVMSNLRRGETVTHYTDIAQDAVARYLQDVDEYTNIYNNHITYVTDAAARGVRPMVWTQTAAMCSQDQFWDAGVASCVECPNGQTQSSTDKAQCVPKGEKGNASLIAAIVVPIVTVIAALLAAGLIYLEYKRRTSLRNTDHAPKGGDAVTILFTDIRSSTKLWGNVPASMAVALDTHHRVIRSCIADFEAYEVKTIGDSFMIASNSVDSAVRMAVAIQERLAREAWPVAIAEIYSVEGEIDEVALLHSIDDEPDTLVVNPEGFTSGIRVRIGVNTGVAEVSFDEVAKGYDYYGPAVNLAARIESAAQGGQILASRAVANALTMTGEGAGDVTFTVNHFTEAALPGIDGATELMQVTPNSLAHRVFLPDRISKKTLDDSDRSDSTFDEAIKAHGIIDDTTSHAGEDSLNNHLTEAMSVRSYAILSREVLLAVTRLMDPSTRDRVVRALALAWRVQNVSAQTNQKVPTDDLIAIVANRAGPSVKRSVTTLVLAGPGLMGCAPGAHQSNSHSLGATSSGGNSRRNKVTGRGAASLSMGARSVMSEQAPSQQMPSIANKGVNITPGVVNFDTNQNRNVRPSPHFVAAQPRDQGPVLFLPSPALVASNPLEAKNETHHSKVELIE